MREGGFSDLFLPIEIQCCQCPFCFCILTAFSYPDWEHSFQFLPLDDTNAEKEVTVLP